MRVLGIGDHNDLGDLYLRLVARGHDVRVHVADVDSQDVLAGLVPFAGALDDELSWAADGLIVFEGTGYGALQDRLRAEGRRVVGGSALGDRLELDRHFGQRALAAAGMNTAPAHEFSGFDDAIAFAEKHPRRYVLKFSGGGFSSTRTYVGALDDGRDLLALLRHQRRVWSYAETPQLLLMDHLQGVEVGVGGFFDGRQFLRPINVDFEHKRFFPDDLGELTGEMGTVVSYRGADKLFSATLARLSPMLCDARHVGYVNLNLIVDERGAWPLELTCRFGYPGFAILSALHREPWDSILLRVAAGEGGSFDTHDGYAVGVVLTVPPFPYPDGYARLSKGAPICFRDDLDDDDRAALHYGEVGLDPRDGALVTAGQIGYVMVVTGRGATVADARELALARARKVVVPNVRYRTDIGRRLESRDHAELVRLGWTT